MPRSATPRRRRRRMRKSLDFCPEFAHSEGKLSHIRLLGFAGKDARCYPSLEKLGASLGVSERQARDYVKELERCGFIVVEQRGLRKTNSYLFVWTAELERLSNTVPESGDDP